MNRTFLSAWFALLGAFASAAAAPLVPNGFALEPAEVSVREILSGGPGRDGIPALDHPDHADAGYELGDGELVVGVAWKGAAR